MRPARQSLRRSPALRRRLTLALATAEERLLEAHARAAADFLRATAEELPYQRSLEVFARIIGVPERMREPVAMQALATLAEEPTAATSGPDLAQGLRGMLLGIRRRLEGRRADGLRTRVDRAARRARNLVEDAYLEGASLVVRELKDSIAPPEAVQLYIEALEIGHGWGEWVFHGALAASGGAERERPVEPGEQVA